MRWTRHASVPPAFRRVPQWRGVHNLTACAPVVGQRNAHPYRVWRDARGRVFVEDDQLTGMGHGTPLDTAIAENSESAGAFLVDVGLSSSLAPALARGLLDEAAIVGVTASPDPVPPQSSKTVRTPLLAGVNTEVLKIIEDIVGSTGLMR